MNDKVPRTTPKRIGRFKSNFGNWTWRGYLPHFDDGSAIQFVTFRLADSLPKEVIERWRDMIDRGKLDELGYQRKIERFLDQGYGEQYLAITEIALMIESSLRQFDGVTYRLIAWVIMPNHAHLLLVPLDGAKLSAIMQRLKSYTSHEANRMLGRRGHFWNKEYFDRYIRDGEHFSKTLRYIEMNPVKAGLCETPEDWPFGSARFKNK